MSAGCLPLAQGFIYLVLQYVSCVYMCDSHWRECHVLQFDLFVLSRFARDDWEHFVCDFGCFLLLGVLASDAALLIAQAQHTFWMSRMFGRGFIFYCAWVRIYFIHDPNMERLKVIGWLVTSMLFIHMVTEATPKLTKHHRFECSSWLLQRPEAFLRYLHPFPSSRPKKSWKYGLDMGLEWTYITIWCNDAPWRDWTFGSV